MFFSDLVFAGLHRPRKALKIYFFLQTGDINNPLIRVFAFLIMVSRSSFFLFPIHAHLRIFLSHFSLFKWEVKEQKAEVVPMGDSKRIKDLEE
jgi:hypothetical protein